MIKGKIKSIKTQLMLVFAISYAVISLTVGIICFLTMAAITVTENRERANEMVSIMEGYISPATVMDYVETGVISEGLEISLRQSVTILKSFKKVRNMGIYMYQADGSCKRVYEIISRTDDMHLEKLGKEFAKNGKNKAISGLYNGADGHKIFIYSKPVLDNSGKYLYSIQLSMDTYPDVLNNLYTTIELVIFMVMLTYLIHSVNAKTLDRVIVKPLKEITECTKNFRYKDQADSTENMRQLMEVEPKINNEIREVYYAFVMALRKTSEMWQEIDATKAELRHASFLAYKDPLTRVGNKADYDNKLKLIQDLPEYAIIVADVNELKYINDTYGHQYGDEYLKGCCQLLCDTFKDSPVCRTGGDEFTVFLTYDKYKLREEYMKQLKDRLKQIKENGDVPIWEKYSVAVGMADKQDAETIEKVVILADARMYKNKQEIKQGLHNYRTLDTAIIEKGQ